MVKEIYSRVWHFTLYENDQGKVISGIFLGLVDFHRSFKLFNNELPIDLAASIASGTTQVQKDKVFAERVPDYYRLDLRVSLKRNYKKVTSTVALDLQNSTNRENPGGQYFDKNTGEIKYWYQAPLIPILSYRVEF